MRTSPSSLSGEPQNSISIYQDALATDKDMLIEIKRLKKAFPELSRDFYSILIDRLTENRFTASRLNEAVSNLIDTFRYPQPTISDIVGYDKRVKVYTYSEICDKVSQGHDFREFIKIKGSGWVTKVDASRMGHIV